MYEHIREHVEELSQAYRWNVPDMIREAHDALVERGLAMAVESVAQEDADRPNITGRWSNHGSEGAAALLKAVELANHSRAEVIPRNERSLLCTLAALEYYRCGRHGVAAAILKREDSIPPEEESPNPALRLVNLLQPLCRSEFGACWTTARSMMERIRAETTALTPSAGRDYPLLGNLVAVCTARALLCLRDHLHSGNQEPLETGHRWLERARAIARRAGDPEVLTLTQTIYRAYRWLRHLSLWNIRDAIPGTEGSGDILLSWIRHRIDSDMPFLFPTQLEALIDTDLLGETYSLASMPTGGGKSLLAEVSAIHQLDLNRGSTVIMIVPTRALASEKRADLQEAVGWDATPLRVCQLTGDVAFDTQEALIEHDIVVCTPEKFDVLLRERFFEVSVSGVIVDEFHTIRRTYRGVKLQLSIARFQDLYDAPILFISAIIRGGDLQALGEWAKSSQPFITEWKPTPSRIGLVKLDQHPWAVKFTDGTTQTVEPQDSPRRDATRQASIQIVSHLLQEDQVLHFNLYWRGWRDSNQLLELAEEYQAYLPEMDYLEPDSREELASRLARLVGEDHPITKAFRRGIAIHWGELPHAARGIMETAVREKAVGLILSTSTLAAGVNLPLKTVYVPKLSTGPGGPLEIGLFLNVIGRAGRPFWHPEGQVVVASCEAGRDDVQTSHEEAERYAEAGPEQVERIRTAATEAARLLDQIVSMGLWDGDAATVVEDWKDRLEGDDDARRAVRQLLAEVENLSAALLAAIEERLIQAIMHSDRLRDVIFIGPETEEERSGVERLLKVVEDRLRRFGALEEQPDRLVVTEWGRAVYLTGFGPESCVLLRERLEALWPGFSQRSLSLRNVLSSEEDRRIFDSLLETLGLPREASRMGGHGFDRTDFYILRGWVAGTLTQRIAEDHGNLAGDYLKAYTRLEGLLSAYGAWVFYALHIIAGHVYGSEEDGVDELLSHARSVWYGHYDGRVKTLMRRDANRELLRDDVIVAFRALDDDQFRALLHGELGAEGIEQALRSSAEVTKRPEPEVAKILAGLEPREPDEG